MLRSFMFLAFMFRSMMPTQINFVCGVRCRDGASFFHVDTLHHLLKQPSFPHSADTLIKHCMCAQLLSCVQLFCDLMDWSPPGSSVHGIFQARILEWVAIPFSRGSSQPRDQTSVSCIGRQILYRCITWEAH